MRPHLYALLLLLLIGTKALAQPLQQIQAGAAFGPRLFVYSGGYEIRGRIGNRFQLGGGLRANGASFSARDLRAIDQGKYQGPSVRINQASLGNVALYAAAQVRVWKRLGIGANIDLVGVGFGPGASQAGPDSLLPANQPYRPNPLSLLLVDKRDIGLLNSELFAYYQLLPYLIVRAGVSHQHLELRYRGPGDGANTRYAGFATGFVVGIAIPLNGLADGDTPENIEQPSSEYRDGISH